MKYLKEIIIKILTYLAQKTVEKHKPYIIALVGSVGKTMARETIYAVLSKKNSVRTSEKSLTTDIGVPLTILGCPYTIRTLSGWIYNMVYALKHVLFIKQYPQYVILEIDGHTKGEMARLVKWLPIDMLVVTTIGEIPAHVEYFQTPDALREEYMSVQKALKDNGKLVVYADDQYAHSFASDSHQTITYGSKDTADISAHTYTILYEENKPIGISFSLKKPLLDNPVIIKGALGMHTVNAALASMGVLQALGEHPFSMLGVFEKLSTPPGRMKILLGIKDSVIIDDSYNSSPVAVEELTTVMGKVNGKRKIIVLGDMLELGRFSAEAHREVGRESTGVDMLVCVGVRAKFIKEGALEKGMEPASVLHFDTPEKAGEYLQNVIVGGDIIAVKGSQDIRMERCVEEIMAEPQSKEKLLVRQSEEWLGR